MSGRHQVVDEAQLRQLARDLARELKDDETIYLSGELGTGKTTFTRHLLEELAADPPATSPTFSLINRHRLPNGRQAVHADLYRLDSPDDVNVLGLAEFIADPQTLVLVEWPERGEGALPAPTRHLHFSHHTPNTRVISQL